MDTKTRMLQQDRAALSIFLKICEDEFRRIPRFTFCDSTDIYDDRVFYIRDVEVNEKKNVYISLLNDHPEVFARGYFCDDMTIAVSIKV